MSSRFLPQCGIGRDPAFVSAKIRGIFGLHKFFLHGKKNTGSLELALGLEKSTQGTALDRQAQIGVLSGGIQGVNYRHIVGVV